MQVVMKCKDVRDQGGAGGGGRQVTLVMDPPVQGGVNGSGDDWRFSVAPTDPNYSTFSKGSFYTVDINPA